MNLQQVITSRVLLTPAQELGLIECIGFKTTKATKEKIKQVIRNSMYSFFEDKSYSKQFVLTDLGCDFVEKVKGQRAEELLKVKRDIAEFKL